MKLQFFVIIIILFFCGCWNLGRTDIAEIRNCVILKQHCGFDNLDAGYYQVKDLKSGIVKRVDVDIRDCDLYKVGDTIR